MQVKMLYSHDEIRINVSTLWRFCFPLVCDKVQLRWCATPLSARCPFFVRNTVSLLFHVPTPVHPLRFILSRAFTDNPSLNPQAEVCALHAPPSLRACVQA